MRFRFGRGRRPAAVFPAAALMCALLSGGASGTAPAARTDAWFEDGLRIRRMAVGAHAGRVSGGRDVEVFLTGDPDPRRLLELGVRTGVRIGAVRSARVPLDRLEPLAEVPGLSGIILARPLTPLLDASIDSVRAGTLRSLLPDGTFQGSAGRGVIVGIVDSGVDPTHGDFRRPDGTSRILAYWDQGDSTGTPPVGPGGGLLYGSEWTGDELLLHSRAWDPVGHGTHVAGVAAGNGSASLVDSLRHRFVGVAPEAELVVVAADLLLETSVLDAVAYVFTRAEALGKPAVVNLSLGTQFGPHDGSTPLEQGLDALAGPGRLIVASAGNEGEDRVHAEIVVAPGGVDSASVFLGPYTPGEGALFFAVNAFHAAGDAFDITVVSPGGRRYGPVPPGASLGDTVTAEGTVFLAQAAYPASPDLVEVAWTVSNFDPDPGDARPPAAPASGEWKLVFRDRNLAPSGGEIDLWMALAGVRDGLGNEPYWLRGYEHAEEIASPGTARSVITVGSSNTKACWPDSTGMTRCTTVTPPALAEPGRITFFSSVGPTRDGREKPEIVAPGFVVAAARSHQLRPELAAAYRLDRTLQPDREHFVFAGTSASAPHVAGALALLLEREPQVDPGAARERLRASARKDEHTGESWTLGAGHGKLDVAGLLGPPVPVQARRLEIALRENGLPRLSWQAQDGDPVVRFRLSGRGRDGGWELRGDFPGPGPHGYDETRDEPSWEYELMAVLRQGGEELWARAEWERPSRPRLGAAVPNPFTGICRVPVIGVALPGREAAEAVVVDLAGRRLRTLGVLPGSSGTELLWDGRDARGREVPAGVYWIRLSGGAGSNGVRVVKRR